MGLYLYNRNKGKPDQVPNWYIGGYPTGRPQRPTGLRGVDKEALARKVLAREQAELLAAVRAAGPSGQLTVQSWASTWLAELKGNRHRSAPIYESRLSTHVFKPIGTVALVGISKQVLEGLLRDWKARVEAGEYASRTFLAVWKTVKQLLRAAVEAGHLPSVPKVAKELVPEDEDRDPYWRDEAVFSKDEAEALIFDERIPEDRRMLYALLFLLGVRIGEASALVIRAYTHAEGLRKMAVAKSWSQRERRLVPPKGKKTRDIPVVSLLQELLDAWLAPGGGRERFTGTRRPGSDLPIVPARRAGGTNTAAAEGRHRGQDGVLDSLHRDLATLGLRPRRVHDTRRTWVSLIMRKGGHKETVRWMSHGRPKASKDVFDGYNQVDWETRCREAERLPLERPGAAEPARQIVNGFAGGSVSNLQDTYTNDQPLGITGVSGVVRTPGCSSVELGHVSPALGRAGSPAGSELPLTAVSRPAKENGRHLCPSVSAVRGALKELERGRQDKAIAILRKALGKEG